MAKAQELAVLITAQDQASATLDRVGKKGHSMGTMLKAGAAIGVAAVAAIGIAAFKIGEDFDKAYDKIIIGTGATGRQLEALKASTKAVFGAIPTDLNVAAGAITEFNTKLGLTGPALEAVTIQTLEMARMVNEDSAAMVRSVSQVFNQFQISAEEMPGLLDAMFKASQNTGIGVNQLMSSTANYGAVLKNAGFTLIESIALFAMFEKSGIAVSRVMPGLNAAMRKWATENKNIQVELGKSIQAIKTAKTDTEALAIATEIFGAEGAQRMSVAIRTGVLDIDSLSKSMTEATGVISDTALATMSASEKFTLLKNQVMSAVEPIGHDLYEAASGLADIFLHSVVPAIEAIIGGFKGLDPMIQKAIGAFVVLAATVGPVLLISGKLIGILGGMGAPLAAVTGGTGALSVALGVLAGPAAIGAVVAGLIVLGIQLQHMATQTLAAKSTLAELEAQAGDTARSLATMMIIAEEAPGQMAAWGTEMQIASNAAKDLVPQLKNIIDQMLALDPTLASNIEQLYRLDKATLQGMLSSLQLAASEEKAGIALSKAAAAIEAMLTSQDAGVASTNEATSATKELAIAIEEAERNTASYASLLEELGLEGDKLRQELMKLGFSYEEVSKATGAFGLSASEVLANLMTMGYSFDQARIKLAEFRGEMTAAQLAQEKYNKALDEWNLGQERRQQFLASLTEGLDTSALENWEEHLRLIEGAERGAERAVVDLTRATIIYGEEAEGVWRKLERHYASLTPTAMGGGVAAAESMYLGALARGMTPAGAKSWLEQQQPILGSAFLAAAEAGLPGIGGTRYPPGFAPLREVPATPARSMAASQNDTERMIALLEVIAAKDVSLVVDGNELGRVVSTHQQRRNAMLSRIGA